MTTMYQQQNTPPTTNHWLNQAIVVDNRPSDRETFAGLLSTMLKETYNSGRALMLPLKSLPMQLKSLRTQTVAVAKSMGNYRSHVIQRDSNVYLWLSDGPIAGAAKAKKRNKRGPGRPKKTTL